MQNRASLSKMKFSIAVPATANGGGKGGLAVVFFGVDAFYSRGEILSVLSIIGDIYLIEYFHFSTLNFIGKS